MKEYSEANMLELQKSRLEEEILTRGVVDIIDAESLKKRLEQGVPLRVKYGIDPTMQSAHIGHATPIRKLRQFQELGHTAVFVIGDYTARIGDPTGKKAPRKQLSPAEVQENAKRYFDQAYKILDKDKTEVHLQSEWYNTITLEEIMEIMSTVTYARIMSHETFAVRARENKPLGFQEMMYPILQAYDSVMLKADVELGGADQRFNFVLTRDIQKAFGQQPEEVVLTRYLPGTDGNEKMSKSLGNTIDLLDSANDMYAKIMSVGDELMPVYFELGTDLPISEIQDLVEQFKAGSIHPVELKKILARSITALYHSPSETDAAEAAFKHHVQDKNIPQEIPKVVIPDDELDLANFLVGGNYVKSKSELRRLLSQKGVALDGAVLSPDTTIINIPPTGTVLKIGKRRFIKLLREK